MSMTVAGLVDLRQRLNSDGLAALGLAGPLLCPAWSDAVPTANEATLTLTMSALWYAPFAGVLTQVTNGTSLGLSLLDGSPAVTGDATCVVLRIHPQARLRIER